MLEHKAIQNKINSIHIATKAVVNRKKVKPEKIDSVREMIERKGKQI